MSTLSQFGGGGIKGSVQRGTISIPAGLSSSATATVNSVDVNKSLLTNLGQTGYYSSSSDGTSNTRIFLTNGTTITAQATFVPNVTNFIVSYELVEYY